MENREIGTFDSAIILRDGGGIEVIIPEVQDDDDRIDVNAAIVVAVGQKLAHDAEWTNSLLNGLTELLDEFVANGGDEIDLDLLKDNEEK